MALFERLDVRLYSQGSGELQVDDPTSVEPWEPCLWIGECCTSGTYSDGGYNK
jgi:hypothetical protein